MSVGLQIIICNDLIKSILFTIKYTVCSLDCTHLCIKSFCKHKFDALEYNIHTGCLYGFL